MTLAFISKSCNLVSALNLSTWIGETSTAFILFCLITSSNFASIEYIFSPNNVLLWYRLSWEINPFNENLELLSLQILLAIPIPPSLMPYISVSILRFGLKYNRT